MRKARTNAGAAKKKAPTANKRLTPKVKPKAPEWACVEMQRAGFAGAVRPDWLCQVLEHQDDSLREMVSFPGQISDAVTDLRKLAAHFPFNDDYLRPKSGEWFENPDDARQVAACRFSLAFDRPRNERLPTMVSRAYRRTCEYARFMRGDPSSAETRWQKSARLAAKITAALEILADEGDPEWGLYSTRGGAWKGGPLRETVDFLRGRVIEDSTALEMLDTKFCEIDETLKTLKTISDQLKAGASLEYSTKPSRHAIIRATSNENDKISDDEIGPGFDVKFTKSRTLREVIMPIDERDFFILRIMELFVISTGKRIPFDQSERKRDVVWQDYRNCVTRVCGVRRRIKDDDRIEDLENVQVVNDLRKLKANGGFHYVNRLVSDIKEIHKSQSWKLDPTFCDLLSARELWRVGLGSEPLS